jgi:uncharacterized membrane protein
VTTYPIFCFVSVWTICLFRTIELFVPLFEMALFFAASMRDDNDDDDDSPYYENLSGFGTCQ